MSRESIVEIPSGSGNKYRYEYSEGKTRYKGPVGDAPEIGEAEFNMVIARKSSNDIQLPMNNKRMEDIWALAESRKNLTQFRDTIRSHPYNYDLTDHETDVLWKLHKAYNRIYQLEGIRSESQTWLNTALAEWDEFGDSMEKGRTEFMINTTAPSAAGQNQDNYVIDEFDDIFDDKFREEYWDKDEDRWGEWTWEGIEREMDEVADGLNVVLDLEAPKGVSYNFYYGSNPDWGDWGLMMGIELEGDYKVVDGKVIFED